MSKKSKVVHLEFSYRKINSILNIINMDYAGKNKTWFSLL